MPKALAKSLEFARAKLSMLRVSGTAARLQQTAVTPSTLRSVLVTLFVAPDSWRRMQLVLV